MAKYKSIHTGPQIDSGVSRALNPDTTPAAGSSNLITSGGVKSALDDKADQTDLASIHATGTTNTVAYIGPGTYFYLNGTLVMAKTSIPVNATFTDGTNYETVTAGGLNSIISRLLRSLSSNITSSNIDSFTDSGIYTGYVESGCKYTGWSVLIVSANLANVIMQTQITNSGIAWRGYNAVTANTWSNWKGVAFS